MTYYFVLSKLNKIGVNTTGSNRTQATQAQSVLAYLWHLSSREFRRLRIQLPRRLRHVRPVQSGGLQSVVVFRAEPDHLLDRVLDSVHRLKYRSELKKTPLATFFQTGDHKGQGKFECFHSKVNKIFSCYR